MRGKKLALPLLLAAGFITLISFQLLDPDGGGGEGGVDSDISEQEPPRVESIKVKKLSQPLQDGSTMLMAIEYGSDVTLGESIDIHYGPNDDIRTFYDDGSRGDDAESDNIFTAYLDIDVDAFVEQIEGMEEALANEGQFVRFSGHIGEVVTTTPTFDDAAFDLGNWVAVDGDFQLAGIDCSFSHDIVKESSLFITDLAVVEDPARTYNPVGNSASGWTPIGNPTGCWTFGQMMKNMANTASTGVSAKTFIKEWLKNWTVTQPSVNGETIPLRSTSEFVIDVIKPWLERAGASNVQENNWESKWDESWILEADILRFAPFKLTAIVNRIDLRANTAYKSTVVNAGETRFIFTLESVYTNPVFGTAVFPKGSPPKHANTGISADHIDWEGMNIIFEYGNTQTNLCDIKEFAKQWKALGGLSRGSSAFNDALEDITNTVTAANAASGRINGSAINRIRTNEKIFGTMNNGFAWADADWELRQFELNSATHCLQHAPLTNTPKHGANDAYNMQGSDVDFPINTTLRANLMDLIYGSTVFRNNLKNGKHNIPSNQLAGFARIDGEYLHYFGLNFTVGTTHFNAASYSSSTNYPIDRQYRQQLSLNTCQGCHAGETKTIFTHVRPLSYGESADYWGPSPDVATGKYDTRFVSNPGSTQISSYPPNYEVGLVTSLNKVSAFLTGRTYASSNWNDDDPGDWGDNTMDGLYYVNDQDNESAQTLNPHNMQWGYNDLLRRAIDLCELIERNCAPVEMQAEQAAVHGVFEIMDRVRFAPFAVGSH
jgi:hypothetical protein